MGERFWSDDFDMDLPRIIPAVDDALGDAADITLWTHGHTSHGRLNHPSVWHTHRGGVAYFGTDNSGGWKPADYYTGAPIVECTWREVARDAWPHRYIVAVSGLAVWDTNRLSGTFTRLMYDLRGWQTLPEGEADRLRGQVLASLIAATRDLRQLLQRIEAVRS